MQGAIPERKIPLKENNKPAKRVDIGGQAVLEGVMMRSPEYIALAVRRPDGSVVCKRDPYVSPAKKHKWMGWPPEPEQRFPQRFHSVFPPSV